MVNQRKIRNSKSESLACKNAGPDDQFNARFMLFRSQVLSDIAGAAGLSAASPGLESSEGRR
jgi:hypothetical protein